VKALFRSFEQSLDGWPGGDLLAGLLLNRGADDTTSAHPAGMVLNLENADAGQSDFVAVLEMAVVTIRVIVRNLLRPPNAGPA
jgi:hypothetical protein